MIRLFSGLWLSAALAASAHTLPISSLTLVPAEDYLHLELALNPFEMNSPSAFQTNETSSRQKLASHILEALTLRVDGRIISAEVAGIEPDLDSHHLTLRGHYRVDARRADITVESRLSSVMGMSHLTQVTVLRDGQTQLAQLDAHTRNARFAASAPVKTSAPARARTSRGILHMLALALVVWAMLTAFLLLMIRQQIRREIKSRRLKPLEV